MLEKTAFNAPDGQPYQLVQLTNSNGMTVQFMDWGATWLSCKVPVNGELREEMCIRDRQIVMLSFKGSKPLMSQLKNLRQDE